MRNKWKTAAAFSALMIIIIIIIANSGKGRSLFSVVYIVPHGDKLCHFLFMGIFSFLMNMTVLHSACQDSMATAKATVLLLFVVTAEEFSQIFLQHRSFSLSDLFADYAGIGLFGLAAWCLAAHQKNKDKEIIH